MAMSNSDIAKFVTGLESSIKVIKDEIYKISWYMRGGVTAQELLHIYSYEDRTIMSNIIKDNIETTQKTKLPFV
jgi:flagellin-specific chaperone FliS